MPTNYYAPGSPGFAPLPPTPATTTYGANPAFNLNPAPRGGSGPFGAVPGAIGVPNPFGDLSAVFPNLSGTNKAVSSAILSKLGGQLSPTTLNAIKDASAAWGVNSGVPGSQIQTNRGLRDVGLTSEGLMQQGLQDYASLIPVISGTQTVSPALQTEIAATNAQNASAPDPTQAASYAETLFNEYLSKLRGPAGRSGGQSVSGRQALAGEGPPHPGVGAEMAPTNYWQQLAAAG